MTTQNSSSIDVIWKVLLSLVLLFSGAYYASSVLIPLIFSMFLAIMLNPIVSFFERKKVNSILSIILTLLVVFIFLGGGIFYVGAQGKRLIMDLPDLVNRFNSFLADTEKNIVDWTGYSAAEQIDLLKENAGKLLSSGSSFFGGALSVTSDFITFISLVPIYIFFILLYRQNFKRFLKKVDEKQGNNLFPIAIEVKEMVHNYIVGLSIVITIIATLNTIGLLALGLKYAVFMGVLSAVLTIIPYIGIFIGGLLPFLVALLTKDSLFYPLAVIAIVALVQFLEGNFITPKIIGSKVNVNPLAAIVALIIGSKIWGIIGMILAIPITGIIKIILSNSKDLHPYAILLESDDSEEQESSLKDLKIWKKIKDIFKKKEHEN